MPEVIEGSRLPVLSWAPDADAATLAQARNLADLEVARHHVALMADAHVGFGMPIGGVLLTEGAVVPYAIGVDIGCGVQVARTNLAWDDNFGPEKLRNVLHQIQRDIPTGFNSRKTPVMGRDRLLDVMGMDLPGPRSVHADAFDGALKQVGTLGGGNHFLEVQRDPETNEVFFMLHSGSRSLGKKLCDVHAKVALGWCRATGRELPDRDLAWLPIDSEEGNAYWEAMTFALRWAEVNRRVMMDAAEAAFRKHASVHDFERLVDIHHNFAAPETHFGISGIVHRKGAVRAGAGDAVLIPGSMGTASYVGEGLGSADSFETCQHGAGRVLGRNAAKRLKSPEEVRAEMADWGIEFISNEPRTAAEEAAFAYKDIDAVMAASADLVRPLRRLVPLGVVKG
ncbi:MAG TPA: RtcB family protein [Candidatus Limnocylindrales bacterium]|nr:RtcB family protein [Candidatus Limnocylindrales bacterium]